MAVDGTAGASATGSATGGDSTTTASVTVCGLVFPFLRLRRPTRVSLRQRPAGHG